MRPRRACSIACCKNLARQAANLDVHLQSGNALSRSGHLEVHIAVVIFCAGDIGKDGVVIALLHQPHRDAGYRALESDARVEERKTRAAYRSHRRRTVRFEDVRDDADRIRRLVRAWAVLPKSRALPALRGLPHDVQRQSYVLFHQR